MAGRFSARKISGKSFISPFPEFYKEHLPESALPELDHQYHTAFKLLQTGIAPLPHSLEFPRIPAVSAAMPTFLLSSIHHEHFEVQGGPLGWKKFFRQAYVQALDKRKVILHLLAEHDLDPAETIFIGDMVHDIETARHAGVIELCRAHRLRFVAQTEGRESRTCSSATCARCAIFSSATAASRMMPPVPTVGALIFDERGDVLMIQTHKWSHKWGIPGGQNQVARTGGRRAAPGGAGRNRPRADRDLRFELVQDCIDPPEFYQEGPLPSCSITPRRRTAATSSSTTKRKTYRWLSPEAASALDLNGPTRTLLDHVRSHPRG